MYKVDAHWFRYVLKYDYSDGLIREPTESQLASLEKVLNILPKSASAVESPSLCLTKNQISLTTIVEKSSEDLFPIIGLFIETRPLKNIPKLIQSFIDQDLPLIIICGENNYSLVKQFEENKLVKKILKLDFNRFGLRTYNALLMSKLIWEHIPHCYSHVLTLQADTVIVPYKFNSRIQQYLTYDYIGSPWRGNRGIGLWINGGNGGFSIRSLKYCKAASEFFNNIAWPGGEDGYYAFFIEFLGGLVADLSISKTFCMQHSYLDKNITPLGFHKLPSDYKSNKLNYLDICPSIELLE